MTVKVLLVKSDEMNAVYAIVLSFDRHNYLENNSRLQNFSGFEESKGEITLFPLEQRFGGAIIFITF